MTPAQFKQARQALGLSQNEMARALGLSSGRTIRSYELGERTITGPVLVLMSLALDCEGFRPKDYGLTGIPFSWPLPPTQSPDQLKPAPAA